MSAPGPKSDWQRRYDESMARRREEAANADDDFTGGEWFAMELAGCMPTWVGLVAMAVTGVVVWIRRRLRTRG